MINHLFYEVRNSPIHGKGLFAVTDIPAHTKLVKYTGELISREEEERREVENDKIHLTHILRLNDHESLDARDDNGDGKWVNHSCDPNADYFITGHDAWLITTRAVKKGEEITFDYAFPMDTQREMCRCNSPKCRGIINKVSK